MYGVCDTSFLLSSFLSSDLHLGTTLGVCYFSVRYAKRVLPSKLSSLPWTVIFDLLFLSFFFVLLILSMKYYG